MFPPRVVAERVRGVLAEAACSTRSILLEVGDPAGTSRVTMSLEVEADTWGESLHSEIRKISCPLWLSFAIAQLFDDAAVGGTWRQIDELDDGDLADLAERCMRERLAEQRRLHAVASTFGISHPMEIREPIDVGPMVMDRLVARTMKADGSASHLRDWIRSAVAIGGSVERRRPTPAGKPPAITYRISVTCAGRPRLRASHLMAMTSNEETVSYDGFSIEVETQAEWPESIPNGIDGRRSGDVVAVGKPEIDDRRIVSASRPRDGLYRIDLEPDVVAVESLIGGTVPD